MFLSTRNTPAPLLKPSCLRRNSPQTPAEHGFHRYQKDDHSLQNLNQILRHVLSEDVHEETAANQRSKENRGQNYSDRVIASEERHSNAGKAVAWREVMIVTVSVSKHFVDSDHPRECS